MTDNKLTVKEMMGLIKEKYDEEADVEQLNMFPLTTMLLELKTVEKDKDRDIKTPYLKAEILIPREIATNIQGLYNSSWGATLVFYKTKKKKNKNN